MSYKIASFNVHNMGQNASAIKIKKIAQIIRNYDFDIIALQEVFCSKSGIIKQNSNSSPISPLLRELGNDGYGGKWKAYFAAPWQARDAKEGYAFLWNSRIKLPKVIVADGSERIFYPRIFNQYKLNRANLQSKLVRNPLYARFIPIDQPMMEFRIINTHIRYSGSSKIDSDNADDVGLSDIAMRRNEFDVLAKTIYPNLADKVYSAQEAGKLGSFYTIMIGDYNLNLNRAWTKSPYLQEVFEINDNGRKKQMRTFQETLTTIKRITPENVIDFENKPKFSNNFDHVTYDENRFSRRTRYYQSMMDADSLLKGKSCKQLKDSIIIFLCRFDPFKKQIPCYTVKRMCSQDTSVDIADGATVQIFNCRAYSKVKDENLRAFLKYVQTSKAESDFTRRVDDMVKAQKKIEGMKKTYLSWSLHDYDVRNEGIAIGEKRGKAEGIKLGKSEGMKLGKSEGETARAIADARNLLTMGLGTHEQIAHAVGLPLEKIAKLAAEVTQLAP